jgi:hypothetical protein
MPAPYPDELTYNVVCRYLAQWGLQDIRGLLEQLLGVRVFATHPLSPLGLVPIAETAFAGYRDPLSYAARHHTLLPYFDAFVCEPERLRVKAALSRHPNAAVSKLVPQGARTYGMSKHLRICAECAAEQRRTWRETFWTRRHQLPGLHHCPEHRTALLLSPVPLEVSRTFQLAPLDARTLAASRPPEGPPLMGASLEGKIATQSLIALSSAATNACGTSSSNYRSIVAMLGFAGRGGRLRMHDFETSFLKWLEDNECMPLRVGSTRWWRRLLTDVAGSTTPLQHLLLQEFIRVRWRACREVQPELFPLALPWSAVAARSKRTDTTPIAETAHAKPRL